MACIDYVSLLQRGCEHIRVGAGRERETVQVRRFFEVNLECRYMWIGRLLISWGTRLGSSWADFSVELYDKDCEDPVALLWRGSSGE